MYVLEINASEQEPTRRRAALVYAAAGAAVELLRRTTPRIKRWFGRRGAYRIGFLRALMQLRPSSMRIAVNDQTHTDEYLLAAAGNLESVGGGTMRLSPNAAADDGLFNVTLVKRQSYLSLLKHFTHLRRGTHPTLKGVSYFTAREMTIEGPRPVALQIDGDVWGWTPATFQARHRSLRVLGETAGFSLQE
jgi:diacylglycerol kinase (ATP)